MNSCAAPPQPPPEEPGRGGAPRPAPPPRLPGLTLLRVVGEGASGRVYAARRDLDGWRCAVKVVGAESTRSLARLRREVAVLTNLRLPHLIRLHEVIELPKHLALILDLVDGGSIDMVLHQRGHLEVGEVVTVLAPVLATLAALHDRGVVHGDVSAGNVLVGVDGRPQLTDLGAARLVGEIQHEVLATAGFAAPELVAGAQPSAATDVYGAGALGWLMLTGSPAPHGAVRPRLADLVPQAPAALIELIEDCLRGEPARRPDAAVAAERTLAAAPSRPVDVAVGPDPGERLTRRIRAAAAQPEADDLIGALRAGTGHDELAVPVDARVGLRIRLGLPGRVTPRLRIRAGGQAVGAAVAVGRHRSSDAPSGTPSWRPFTAVVSCLAALAVLGVLGWRSWRGGPVAGPVTRAAAVPLPADSHGRPTIDGSAPGAANSAAAPPEPGEPTSGGIPPARPASTTGTLPLVVGATVPARMMAATPGGGTHSSAPAQSDVGRSGRPDPWVELVALVAARADAYERADPTLLDRVYQPGAFALRQDRTRLALAKARGVRYDDVRYRVHPIAVLASTSAGSAAAFQRSATLRVQLDTLPYTVVLADGRRQSRPGSTGSPTDVTLVPTTSGWRIATVAAA